MDIYSIDGEIQEEYQEFLDEYDEDIFNILGRAKDKKTLLTLTKRVIEEYQKDYFEGFVEYRIQLLRSLHQRVYHYQRGLQELLTFTKKLMNQSENNQMPFDLALLLRIDVLISMEKQGEVDTLIDQYFSNNERVRRKVL